jgi:DNA repair exonuclease SbcCD ATPase subunit
LTAPGKQTTARVDLITAGVSMHLKHLQVQGLKSFAGRAEFVFVDGITAIIGPNGSGKSNVADAIRWVLGEQSYSSRRGKRSADMIFAGSAEWFLTSYCVSGRPGGATPRF